MKKGWKRRIHSAGNIGPKACEDEEYIRGRVTTTPGVLSISYILFEAKEIRDLMNANLKVNGIDIHHDAVLTAWNSSAHPSLG